MANPSRVSTLTISGATGSRTWTADAAVQDTAAGASVVITLATSTTGVTPPVQETAYTLNVKIDNAATVVRAFTPGVGFSGTQTFNFTVDGTSGAAARAGLLRLQIVVAQTGGLGATQYSGDSDVGGTPPTLYTFTQTDSGYVRGTTTAVTTLNAASHAYGTTITATTVLGAAPYKSYTVSTKLGALAAVASAASTTVTFVTAQGVTDNRFAASSVVNSTVTTVPNAALVATPWTTLGSPTEASSTVDPRITLPLRAQKDVSGVLGAAADSTSYVIGADVGWMWVANAAFNAGAVNAAGTKLAGLTLKQDLLAADGATIVVTGSSTSDANGLSSRLDFTPGILPPAGNRTQRASVTAPAGAVGLDNATRTIGFASAYTADRAWLIVFEDSLLPGTANKIRARYLNTSGPLAQDTAPTLRVFTIAPDGTDTLAVNTVMTLIGNNTYEVTWTPTVAGAYGVEVRGLVSQSAVDGVAQLTVRTILFDGAGFVGFPSK